MSRLILKFALGLALVTAVPVVGAAFRGVPVQRCAADGVPLVDSPVVRVVEDESGSRSFCCVGCAEGWLRRAGVRQAQVFVTDEVSGAELALEDAWFVRSPIPAQPATLDRVHTFRTRQDAERHADCYRGRVLSEDERPFRGVQ